MLKRIIFFVFISLNFVVLKSQDAKRVRQLFTKINPASPDSTQIRIYIDLCNEYRAKNKDSALIWINKAVKLCVTKKINQLYDDVLYIKATVYYFSGDFKTSKNLQYQSIKIARSTNDLKIESKNFNLLGAIEFNEGNYQKAAQHYNTKLKLSQSLNDTSAIIETYYNISLIHQSIGDFKKAIDYNFKILKLAKTFKNDEAILLSSQGLAVGYFRLNEHAKARAYVKIAKDLAIKLSDYYTLSGIYIDEGNYFQELNDDDSAILCYRKSMAISNTAKDKYHYAIAVCNLSASILNQGNLDSAILLLKEGIHLNEQLNRKQGLASAWRNLANCYSLKNEIPEALSACRKAIHYSIIIESNEDKMFSYEVMYKIKEKLKQADSALYYFQQFIIFKDSINSAAQIREVLRKEIVNEKEESDRKRKQDLAISNATIEKQSLQNKFFIAFSIIISIVLLLLYRNFKQKKKSEEEIKGQKLIIEHKNKDILDSINYSLRIQQAILPSADEIKKLLPNSFLIFKPKDIVSGDFYFIEKVNTNSQDDWVAVSLADCTGHGVPGAFMSIMGYNFLKQSLINKSINDPAQALDFVNRQLFDLLRFEKQEGMLRDGMDVAFIALNKTTNEMAFAGANNNALIITKKLNKEKLRNNNTRLVIENDTHCLFELIPNKQHIGYNEIINRFQVINLKLEKGDQLYMFTDGYADQFGGPKGKKFKYSNLYRSIFENANYSISEQGNLLETKFDEWKKGFDQIDDVSVIGFCI